MTIHKSDFLHIVKERGFFHQCTDEEGLAKVLREQKPVTAYIGFDCTAPSLHVGNLVQITILRWFQKCGHRPIVLMGGGTTKIGDPSGKDATRKLLSDEQIAANKASIETTFRKFLSFSNNESPANTAMMVNNADWLSKLDLIDFLRDFGRHFSVNRMLSLDSVKLRLDREQEFTFLEFNYMILQAYDFIELHKRYDCRVQFGGREQWGNIINGVELNRRLMAEKNQGRHNIFDELFGLTTPLITTASGAKMGKTESGAVWLNADMLSPFDYWQFWRNTEDADVGRFLRFFTELSIPEIEKLEKLQGAEINEAKKILANEATKLCHGEEAAKAAAETARKTFEEGGAGEGLKSYLIDMKTLEIGVPAYKLFHESGIAVSGTAARNLIEGGGARVNDDKITDPRMPVTQSHLTADGYIKLSAGKKQHVRVKVK